MDLVKQHYNIQFKMLKEINLIQIKYMKHFQLKIKKKKLKKDLDLYKIKNKVKQINQNQKEFKVFKE